MKAGDSCASRTPASITGEEKNDPAFVAALAKLGDIYVNDAFSAAHRAHASTEGLGHMLPAYAGRAMQAELEALDKALGSAEQPVIAIVGGAKVSTKLDLLENLVAKVDALVIGGGMANTFLHAQGIDVGKSLAEQDLADTARDILDKAETGELRDRAAGRRRRRRALRGQCAVARLRPSTRSPHDGMILDVGPQSVERVDVGDATMRATLVWNGPLGAFEMDAVRQGHRCGRPGMRPSAPRPASWFRSPAAAIRSRRSTTPAWPSGFTYVSTAGGAFLEWMEGKPLPGVEVLKK